MLVPSLFRRTAPRFSIVIAAFNPSRRIFPTIRSALDQTYRPFEIIVVGDGCTDDTAAVLSANFGRRVTWKNLEHNAGNQWRANNEGIRLARGTHIAYLGHDDIWSKHHLAALATVISARDPDFAVSGAIFHAPEGCRYYQITGLFDDATAAATDFFPPSSFAHRLDVTERINGWRNPMEIRPPVDCEFLLRAAAAGCSFASTKTITVHKFAAGHRYLSYRFPSSAEQERMLARLRSPDGDAEVLSEVLREVTKGAETPAIRYYDFNQLAPGEVHRGNRETKGLHRTPPVVVESTRAFSLETFPGALDWRPLERHPVHGTIRWSGPNPNPLYFVNASVSPAAFRLRIDIAEFADPIVSETLELEVNDRTVAFTLQRTGGGAVLLTNPITTDTTNGVKICFRMPRTFPVGNEPNSRRCGIALRQIEILPE